VKNAEQELQKLKTILDATDDAVICLSLTGIIQSWNRAAEAIFGYTAAEAIGKPVNILLPADRLNEETAMLSRISCGEKIDHFETIRQCKNGDLITISVTTSPVYDAEEGVTGACKIARNITQRKKNEEQLRIAAAIFSTHEAIVITDANANIIRVNQAFESITGFTEAEALGKNPSILKSGHHDDAFYREMWHQLLTTDSWTGEIWDRRKTGEIYPKWLSISVVRGGRKYYPLRQQFYGYFGAQGV
jgi:PAS domain S-box-containing protein